MAIQTVVPSPASFLPPPPPPPRSIPRVRYPISTVSLPPQSSTSLLANRAQPRDVVAWTAAIASHARRGRLSEAATLFAEMLSAGVQPNHVTFVTLLSACADFSSSSFSSPFSALDLGRSLHAYTIKQPPVQNAVVEFLFISTAVVDMYAKCRRADIAGEVFERMPVKNSVSYNTMIAGYMKNGEIGRAVLLFRHMPARDKVSWTAMIDGCVKNGLHDDALEYFRAMQLDEIDPDYVTVLGVLAACTDLGALGHGLWVHCYLARRDLSSNVRLANSLIDMYARCGRVDFAHQVFDLMLKRTLVSWNSMIVGFAANGCCREAIEHFNAMSKEGFMPDGVSFTGVLTACSHVGLVDEGLQFYHLMRQYYMIQPRIEHYGCVVDLLSRARRLEEAMRIVESMPMRPNEVVLGSLLAACRDPGDVAIAERVTAYLMKLKPECDSNYVLLSNIYASIGRWDGVGEVRNMMKAIGLRKQPGFSSIEVGCDIHEFVAGDKSHSKRHDIYVMLNLLHFDMEHHGYEPKRITSLTVD